jgi:hypothetical protein
MLQPSVLLSEFEKQRPPVSLSSYELTISRSLYVNPHYIQGAVEHSILGIAFAYELHTALDELKQDLCLLYILLLSVVYALCVTQLTDMSCKSNYVY